MKANGGDRDGTKERKKRPRENDEQDGTKERKKRQRENDEQDGTKERKKRQRENDEQDRSKERKKRQRENDEQDGSKERKKRQQQEDDEHIQMRRHEKYNLAEDVSKERGKRHRTDYREGRGARSCESKSHILWEDKQQHPRRAELHSTFSGSSREKRLFGECRNGEERECFSDRWVPQRNTEGSLYIQDNANSPNSYKEKDRIDLSDDYHQPSTTNMRMRGGNSRYREQREIFIDRWVPQRNIEEESCCVEGHARLPNSYKVDKKHSDDLLEEPQQLSTTKLSMRQGNTRNKGSDRLMGKQKVSYKADQKYSVDSLEEPQQLSTTELSMALGSTRHKESDKQMGKQKAEDSFELAKPKETIGLAVDLSDGSSKPDKKEQKDRQVEDTLEEEEELTMTDLEDSTDYDSRVINKTLRVASDMQKRPPEGNQLSMPQRSRYLPGASNRRRYQPGASNRGRYQPGASYHCNYRSGGSTYNPYPSRWKYQSYNSSRRNYPYTSSTSRQVAL